MNTNSIPSTGRLATRWRQCLITAGLLALAGCASTPPPPLQALQAAEIAISSAEQARVVDYAALELTQARDKLAAARIAVQEEDMVLAGRLADESRVSAELASARTEMLKAQEINRDMQESIDTLTQEMQRNTETRL